MNSLPTKPLSEKTELEQARYFIKKFDAIPDRNWTTDNYQNGDAYCSMGHCGESNNGRSEESRLFANLFFGGPNVININDGDSKEYQQATPKARILAALKDKEKELIKAES